MTDLVGIFERLGLSQYLSAFVEEGFDSWEVVLYATESDLEALGVRLGHRRKLQKEIAEARGISIEQVIGVIARSVSTDELPYGDSDSRSITSQGDGKSNAVTGPTKRKYRRHPKPDENAPERPPSAYVIFSNKTREDLKPLKLTFTDIAKTVGERWQVLNPEEKEQYETQAATAKEQYNAAISKYKRTSLYKDYQSYLADFKARNAPPLSAQSSGRSLKRSNLYLTQLQAGVKRPKLETEVSGASSSGGSVNIQSNGDSDPRRREGGGGASSTYLPSVESTATSPTAISRGISSGSRDSSALPSLPNTPANNAFPPSVLPSGPARGYFEASHHSNRLPPMETRDTRPLISSLISDPSPVPNPRRTPAPVIPITGTTTLFRQETSKSSTSSNWSRESGGSPPAYTPITPHEDTRLTRSLPRIPALMQHGPLPESGPEKIEHRPAQSLPTRFGSELGDTTPESNSGYHQSFHHLSLNPDQREAHRLPSPHDGSGSSRPVLPPVALINADSISSDRIDSLSLLAMAGNIVDRDDAQTVQPPNHPHLPRRS